MQLLLLIILLSRVSEYVNLTYNFNLGAYDGTYWIILDASFGDGSACYSVYKNCDVVIGYWDTANSLPSSYVLT